jgi:GIY-YIG catalytic domain
VSQRYRRRALRDLTNHIGVYALCDLDEIPIYVGQSVDGIRQRVNRHLTSARSDIIANRQIDVWEIAFVKAWPVVERADIPRLEAVLFKFFDDKKTLMNGSTPPLMEPLPSEVPKPTQIVQVMSEEDIRIRRNPMLRLPRQIEHIGRLVDYLLTVKDVPHFRRSLTAHFERLDAYRAAFLRQGEPVIRASGQTEDE